MLDESVLDFYDDLAEDYHLIFVNWHHAVSWQGEVLSKFIHAKIRFGIGQKTRKPI